MQGGRKEKTDQERDQMCRQDFKGREGPAGSHDSRVPKNLKTPLAQHQHRRKGEGTGGETQTNEGRMLLGRSCRRSPTSLDLESPRRHFQTQL